MKRTNFILQAAVAAAFGVTAAQAATFAGTGPVFAKEALKGATSTTTVTFPATSHNTVVVTGTEGYVNRLQPLNVKVQLNNGAKFGAAVTLASANVFKLGNYTADGSLTTVGYATAAAGTIVTGLPVQVVGGGNVGDTFVTFSVDPTSYGLKPGGLDLGALTLKAINTSLAAGTAVTADVTLVDPTTNTTLDSLTAKTVASSATALKVTVTAATSPKKIDVAQTSLAFDSATNGGKYVFDAGSIKAGVSANTYYLPNGNFAASTDVSNVDLQVAGLSSFDTFATAAGVFLDASATGTSTTADLPNATPSTADGASFTIATGASLATGFEVFFAADSTTAIEEGTPTIQVLDGLFNSVTGVVATAATPLAPMLKNGYSAKYPLVFASGDAALGTTYVRLVNNTSVAGKVFFTFKDATGAVVGTANASTPVAAKQALLWTDKDIEALTGTLPTGAFYRLEISTTLPNSGVVTQAYVLTPNMSINNITAEKNNGAF